MVYSSLNASLHLHMVLETVMKGIHTNY